MAEDVTPRPGPPPPEAPPVSPALTRREIDYALLAVLVRVQHLRHAEALALLNAMLHLGARGPEVLLARAVVELSLGDFNAVLSTIRALDRIDPPEVGGGRVVSDRVRVRSYMKARAIFALTGKLDAEGRASLDFYLRQGPGTGRQIEG